MSGSCPLTLKPPSRSNVGSRPTEKIRRRMVEAMSALIPWGWGSTMTIASETSIAIHSRADRWGSRVPEDEGDVIRARWESFHSIFSITANYFNFFIKSNDNPVSWEWGKSHSPTSVRHDINASVYLFKHESTCVIVAVKQTHKPFSTRPSFRCIHS